MPRPRLLVSPLAVAAAVAVTLLLRSVTVPLGQGPVVLTVKTGEWFYEPKEISVASSSAVSLTLEHVGSVTIPHDIVFELADGQKAASKRIMGGQTDVLGFTAPAQAGEYVFYCSVGNHRARGMEGKLIVAASGSAEPSPMMTDVGTPTPEATATSVPLPTASSTPKPRPAFMPLVFRDPTATRTPTPTPSNTPVPPTATRVPPTSVPPTVRPTLPLPPSTLRPEPTQRPCCKCCTRGRSKPCGDTCIAESRSCNTPPGCACFCVLSPLSNVEVCDPKEVNRLIQLFPELAYEALPELGGGP